MRDWGRESGPADLADLNITETNAYSEGQSKEMAFDDPLVWVLIIAVVVFLFGANKIPGLARAFGQAKKEFDEASKSPSSTNTAVTTQQQAQYPQTPPPMASPSQTAVLAPDDPLVVAAQREGIDTQGKTREQIASELSWKLNRK